jgi:hypothetical protein
VRGLPPVVEVVLRTTVEMSMVSLAEVAVASAKFESPDFVSGSYFITQIWGVGFHVIVR